MLAFVIKESAESFAQEIKSLTFQIYYTYFQEKVYM